MTFFSSGPSQAFMSEYRFRNVWELSRGGVGNKGLQQRKDLAISKLSSFPIYSLFNRINTLVTLPVKENSSLPVQSLSTGTSGSFLHSLPGWTDCQVPPDTLPSPVRKKDMAVEVVKLPVEMGWSPDRNTPLGTLTPISRHCRPSQAQRGPTWWPSYRSLEIFFSFQKDLCCFLSKQMSGLWLVINW